AEVALALVLLLGAGLLLGSFARVLRQDPGFDPRGVLAAEVPLTTVRYDTDAASVAFYDQVLARVRALPGVRAAGALSMVPLTGELDTWGFHVEDQPLRNPALAPSVVLYLGAPGTPETLGLRLLSGRYFGAEDRAGAPRVAVVGEGLARRYWPRRSPLGARVQFGSREDDWRTVVGVVADMRHDGLEAEAPLQAHVPYAQASPWRLHLLVRAGGDPAALAPALRREVRAVDPQIPVADVRTLEEVLHASLARRRFGLLLVGGFAALALLLAGVGIYGLVAYTVQQRLRELGVRRALGATSRHLHALVLRRGLGHTALGVALGWGAGLLLARSIRSLLFGVAEDDPATYAAIAAAVLAVALLACWLPARRAAAVDPAVVLRGD
ncbi:MAG TPA: FtsX-like permease family protein, partial [Thermoanaerobaculia bacterium]|nr:FtsX-like permease family protein [Thermoanaerobaculia bacterium]